MNENNKGSVLTDEEMKNYREYIAKIKKRRRVRRVFLIILALLLALAAVVCTVTLIANSRVAPEVKEAGRLEMPDWVDVQLIGMLGTARSGKKLETINNIVIHYVGNPSTSAKNNRNYFATPGTNVCSHFLVGLDGEIIQCVPIDEKSAASNNRNKDTISIEVCHPDESGQFNEKSYDSVVQLTAWLCAKLDLDEDDVIRHYDITGKKCPLYYVDHDDAWQQIKNDIGSMIPSYK